MPANEKTTAVVMERPNRSSSFLGPKIDARSHPHSPQTTGATEDISEPIRASLQALSIPVVDVTSAATPPGRSKAGTDEMEGKPARQDPTAADPATQLYPDDTKPELITSDMIVGIWSPEGGTCSARDFRGGVLPTVIGADGAWAGDTFCMFTKKQRTETGWRIVAECSNPREHWTSNVRLTVNDHRLTWTSKRGMQSYARCAPDVLMARAP